MYKVDFNRDVTACYAVATIVDDATADASGEIAAEIGTARATRTASTSARSDSSGAPADLPFHLIVTC